MNASIALCIAPDPLPWTSYYPQLQPFTSFNPLPVTTVMIAIFCDIWYKQLDIIDGDYCRKNSLMNLLQEMANLLTKILAIFMVLVTLPHLMGAELQWVFNVAITEYQIANLIKKITSLQGHHLRPHVMFTFWPQKRGQPPTNLMIGPMLAIKLYFSYHCRDCLELEMVFWFVR